MKIPGKVKYFCWLAINRKILTWDSLQARGFYGPRVCVLYHLDVENVDHIFGSCPIFQQLGRALRACLKKPWQWVSRPLVEIFEFWVKTLCMPLEILCLSIWEVWRSRNDCIFQDKLVSYLSTMSRVCSSPHFPEQSSRSQFCRSVENSPIIQVGNVGYFDGATKYGLCGDGMYLLLGNSSSFKLPMDVGRGSNTKTELLALWGLLFFANQRMITDLQILGDSKFIIDWALDKHQIHVINLDHWMNWDRTLKEQFRSLMFQHIYREFNREADDLSKQAMGIGSGRIF